MNFSFQDDWIILSALCGESGGSASIDMLNSEYPAMLKLARLAEILGDRELRDQALYRAARRMVPTLARFTFKNYAAERKLFAFNPANVYGVGFSESESGFRFNTASQRSPSYHLYDMSQGIPPKLFTLYKRYIPKEEEEYLTSAVIPMLFNKDGSFRVAIQYNDKN